MLSFSKSKRTERGSIMLEVIAVLALMGVMGAMLFRQIYQRNEELHNIQMASEIRTVKEAFSAYIQAARSELLNTCPNINPSNSDAVLNCGINSATLATSVKGYLPDGWFEDGLASYYTFSLWIYEQNETTKKKVLYGLIVPTASTLPTNGWNFKRAARVALLIGADGGVYDSGMSGDINGALGTWHLDPSGVPGITANSKVYVAMTGTDVFTPEYELPEGEVKLRQDWTLATQGLHAWQQFTAGSKKDCFIVEHHTTGSDAGEMRVQNDTYKPGCHPLFQVDNTSSGGKVFVNHDLEIGKDDTTNVTIRQEGPIVFNNASVQDPQTIVGGAAQNVAYVLDPQYTSVMNDVKIMSRGGAKLSELLPKYIFKKQETLECNIQNGDTYCETSAFTAPTCSTTGHSVAQVIIPQTIGVGVTKGSGGAHSHPVNVHIDEDVKNMTVSSGTVGSHYHHLDTTVSTNTENAPVPNIITKVGGVAYTVSGGKIRATLQNSTTNQTGSNIPIKVLVQHFCVDANAVKNADNQVQRKSASGAGWSAFKEKIHTQAECLSYGGNWASSKCN